MATPMRARPARTTPPPPPPAPMPASISINDDDYDDGLIEDSQYSPAGDDYVVALGGDMAEQGGEATAVGTAPNGGTGKRGKRTQGW
ncbi:MAG TPA: hypothetical protein VFK02_30330 [Kofleriaceae bacterium]|nr:hypothetical protein [Kofleriaceae bacterium]